MDMESVLKSDLDKQVKIGEIEVFTAEQIKAYAEDAYNTIEKSEGSKSSLYNEVATEIRSFKPVSVTDDETLEKSIRFIRRAQIKWDDDNDISKSRGGVYLNTPENRKMGRVGKRYGGEKKVDSVLDRAAKGEMSGKEFNEHVRDFANRTNSNRENEEPKDYSSVKKIEFKIGDKIELDDGIYTISRPSSIFTTGNTKRLEDDELYLTKPGAMGFSATKKWLRENMISKK